MIGAAGLLLTSAVALAIEPEFTFGAKTRPAGLAVLSDLWAAPGDVQVGFGPDVYFFWYEADLRARATVLGGFLVVNGWAGWEPGWFVPADQRDGPRQFMSRPLGRGRIEMNLRNDLLWLYVRNTGWTRHRSFHEYDPFRDQLFVAGWEWSGEHSTALMASPSGTSDRKVWFYGEITLEASWKNGWLDRLPRGGVIIEKLTPTISMDLDVYYSLMDNALGGPGVLAVVWWSPRAGKN